MPYDNAQQKINKFQNLMTHPCRKGHSTPWKRRSLNAVRAGMTYARASVAGFLLEMRKGL